MKNGKKSKENLIGKIIYGFLLFMPLLAIGITCAYVIFNKNAYQSYYGETINQQENVYTYQMKNGGLYYLETPNQLKQFNSNGGNTSSQISVSNLILLSNNVNDFSNIDRIGFYSSNNDITFRMYFFKQNESTASFNITSNENLKISFIYNGQTSGANTYFNNNDIFYSITYNKDSFISNVFYYSIDEVKNNSLFNWSTNTGLYTVLNSTCNTLGITTTFIPMLLAYWLLISLMYLLYDIALIMVHMAHNKIHEFEGSI